MIYTTLHNRWLRLLGAFFGEFLCAVAAIFFVVPHGLYTAGIMGLCQLLRSALGNVFGLSFGGYDIAGVIYFIVNIPILVYAFRCLGLGLVVRTLSCTLVYSLFYSLIPVPTVPVLEDMLTSAAIGGIISGVGSGIALTCGATGGGLEVVGLCLAAKGKRVSVGKFSLGFNAVLYLICFLLYDVEVVVYSVIYNFATAIVIDKVHQQNVNVQVLIFTRTDVKRMTDFIIERLGRSGSTWESVGAYSQEPVHVLCICLSKFETEELRVAIREMDPGAFIVVEEGVQIFGNYPKHLQ